jgi:glutamyl-tRNA reductase
MLQPVVFGLNYQTADFELRDRLAFASEEVSHVLKRLKKSGIVNEALLLSTCNRTELYCIAKDIDFVINSLCDMHSVCPRTVRNHSYILHGEECAHHLFRVISGLDSMVLGETEIVAQIKNAMDFALDSDSLGSHLSGLFQMALSIEKEVRNHTSINNVAISMGHAIANLVENSLTELGNSKVLFVGAGQMMQQIAPHFNYLNLEQITIANRTISNAQNLAAKIGASSVDLNLLPEIVPEYSVLVFCCSSNGLLLDENALAKDISDSAKKLVIDLSMPLVTDKNLRKYQNIKLLTVDDIATLVDVGIEKRKLAAAAAEEIISGKLDDYRAWQRKRGLSPLIKRLRDDSDSIRRESLAAAEKQLLNGESPNDVMRQLSIQLTNRLLHMPTVKLCSSNEQLQDNLIELVNYLYGLEAN